MHKKLEEEKRVEMGLAVVSSVDGKCRLKVSQIKLVAWSRTQTDIYIQTSYVIKFWQLRLHLTE